MSVHTVIDSPYGPLTLLADSAGALTGLYTEAQRHRLARHTFGDPDPRPFGPVRAQRGAPPGRRLGEEKPAAYAAVGIPVHLLVDRDAGAAVVHTTPDPERGCYRDIHRAVFGEPFVLPDPIGITLDTEVLKNYVR